MEANFLERGEYQPSAFLHIGTGERATHYWTCYRVQMAISTLFLFGGITASTIGIPSVFRILSDIKFTFTAGLDIPNLDITESITITVDKAELVKYAVLSVSGIFSVFLSTGILYGMAYQNLR